MSVNCLAVFVASVLAILGSVRVAEAAITGTNLYTMAEPALSTYTAASNVVPSVGGQVVGYYSTNDLGSNTHALLWTSSGAPKDLNPAGATTSNALGTSGSQQVGYADTAAAPGTVHAKLWSGTNVAIDLNPAGYSTSVAYGIGSGRQVGSAAVSITDHAFLWSGTAASGIDLHPAGFASSVAYGVDASQQVGYGQNATVRHALVWNGTNVATDVNPTGFTDSWAVGVSKGYQVGGASGTVNDAYSHAMLWRNTAASAIDLHPAGFTLTEAYGVDGSIQVGYGSGTATQNNPHALLWTGSAASVIDLHAYLPANHVFSKAYTITGTTAYGIAYDTNGRFHAVRWTGVPEPSTLAVVAVVGFGLLRRRLWQRSI